MYRTAFGTTIPPRRHLAAGQPWRATSAREPLFGQQQTDAWIQSQAPPKIKSGQKPAIFPTAYYNFPRNFQNLTDFSVSVFVPQCLYQHAVRSGAQAGTAWTRVERNMKGLTDYNLPMHQAYDEHERKIWSHSEGRKVPLFFKRMNCIHTQGLCLYYCGSQNL